MTYSQKYCLVSFINPIDINTEFSMEDWPLHITLADVFSVDLTGTNTQSQLTELLTYQRAFKIFAHKNAILGTKEVTLIKDSVQLRELHESIIDLLETNRAYFNTPEFTREGFLPHCTIQKTGRLKIKDEVLINCISLIDMFPGGEWQKRKVLSVIRLNVQDVQLF
jgi:hypothetical protein